jgi:uncharacterized protein (TIGR02391 family)
MGRRVLDKKVMGKLATKLGKPTITSVNVLVSKKASKLGISAEAALVILAKEQGIGTATYQRKLDAAKQAEIRSALPSMFAISGASGATNATQRKAKVKTAKYSPRQRLKAAIEYLIQDQELRERCQDMLMATKHFDRAINQGTLVLEDRIRNKAQPNEHLVGENLVNFAFKEDIANTVLKIASGERDDQRGYTQILRGVVPAFRNKTHHHIINDFSREDALRVCGFIDVLLRAVDSSQKVR